MDTCQHCGAGINVVKPECGTCGTAVPRQHDQPSAASIAPTWLARFELIEKAGGPSLPKMRSLSFGERWRLLANWWAALFGPFYYFAKGMWKKGISLWAAVWLVTWAIETAMEFYGLPPLSNLAETIAAASVFAVRANIDYYKKTVLRQNGWW